MKRINDGGPVFPVTWTNDSDLNATAPNGMVIAPSESVELPGMTLRDYFAAKAMQGLCANDGYNNHSPATIANEAYGMADAMLAARECK